MIYLLDQKPMKALDAIRTTQISTLPTMSAISACFWKRAPLRRSSNGTTRST
ncbi:MAG: hypothetical protein WDM81_19770 [Rhizomicrobium sp.]